MKNFVISSFSGLVGVLITIGYQHYFALPQTNMVIYDGKEISITKSDCLELIKENKILHAEINKLQENYSEILNENNDLNIKINELNDGYNSHKDDDSYSNLPSPINLFSLPTFKESFWGGKIQLAADVAGDFNKDEYVLDTWGNSYRDAYTCTFDYMDNYGWAHWVFDKPYTKLEGELVANQLTKNDKRAWLEFFDQNGNLLCMTDYVSASEVEHSYLISFEVELNGVTELIIKFRSNSRSRYGLMPKMLLIP